MSRMSPFGLSVLVIAGFMIDWLFSLLCDAITPSLKQLVMIPHATLVALPWRQELALVLVLVALFAMTGVATTSSLLGKAAALEMIDKLRRGNRRDRHRGGS